MTEPSDLHPDASLEDRPDPVSMGPLEPGALTDKQRAARLRLRRTTARLMDEARAEKRMRGTRSSGEEGTVLTGDDFLSGELPAKPRRMRGFARGADHDLPSVVYSPDDAPDGPPWRYDLTPTDRARKDAKKQNRAAKKDRIKQSALKKTPASLKNPSDLQVRFRTGLIYTLLTIVCVLAGNIPTMLYLMVVAGICAGEFFYMLRSDAKLPNEALGIAGAVLYIPATFFWGFAGALVVSVLLLLALLVWYVFWLKARIQDVGVSFFGAAYTGLLLCGLMLIRESIADPWGGVVLFLLFLSVWANDAFAYFVGRKIGKHKLAPRTSPKKSWEGFIAGLVGSSLTWVIMSFVPGLDMSIPMAIVFGAVCGLTEVLGDLAESRIKRNSGFKDSGTIMPGHGGLLDRCDSLFLASTTAAILLLLGNCIPSTFV